MRRRCGSSVPMSYGPSDFADEATAARGQRHGTGKRQARVSSSAPRDVRIQPPGIDNIVKPVKSG
jgi:hypothetical protein